MAGTIRIQNLTSNTAPTNDTVFPSETNGILTEVTKKISLKDILKSNIVELLEAPTSTTVGIIGTMGYYNGYKYTWIDENVVIREAVEITWS